MSAKLLESTIVIAQDYLGPAAERFVRRQIEFHLGKDPHLITESDLPQLAEWVKVSISTLSEDQRMVDEFTKRIFDLRGAES